MTTNSHLDEVGVVSFFAGFELSHDGADQVGILALVEEIIVQHF